MDFAERTFAVYSNKEDKMSYKVYALFFAAAVLINAAVAAQYCDDCEKREGMQGFVMFDCFGCRGTVKDESKFTCGPCLKVPGMKNVLCRRCEDLY